MSQTIHGKYGRVEFGPSAYAEANQWTMRRAVDASQYGKFGGGGEKSGSVGQKGSTGSIAGKYDKTMPIEEIADIGDEVTLKLYVQSISSGGTYDRYYTVPAQITDIDITVDAESALPIGFTLTWQSNGSITLPA